MSEPVSLTPFVCFMIGFLLALPWVDPDWKRQPRPRPVLASALPLNMLGMFGFWVLPVGCMLINSTHQQERRQKLDRISLAMHAYLAESEASRFPPAALRDKAGKSLLSWRVLLLPHLGEQALYDEFRLDEPWDSPHNLALVPRMPKVYAPVSPDVTPPCTTRYQVFVGRGTPFGVPEGPHLGHFPAGTPNTVLVAEAREPVVWTEPADLPYSEKEPLPALGHGSGLRRWGLFPVSGKKFAYSTADGYVRLVDLDSIDEKKFRRAIVSYDNPFEADRALDW